MQPYKPKESSPSLVAMIIAACAVFGLIYYFGFSGGFSGSAKKTESAASENGDAPKNDAAGSDAAVDLKPEQLTAIKIEQVANYSFHIETEAIGSVAYHEKEAGNDAQADSIVTDKATKLIVANIPETSSPLIHVGQPVQVKVIAYPDRVFDGRVSAVGVTVYDSGGNPAIDPGTHRIAARCEIADPKNELFPGMFATVVIQVANPVESVAIPVNGVVRKGDGTMTVWVTQDRKHFEERTVKVGLQQNGYDQILEGLKPGELAATDGAVFISNILYAPPSD